MHTKEIRYGNVISDKLYFSKCLTCLGFSKHYLGFFYMVLILDLLINKNVPAKSFSKNIYPMVAKIYKKAECTVERDIRILLNNCDHNMLYQHLNYDYNKNGKLKCCGFIKLVKDYVLNSLM